MGRQTIRTIPTFSAALPVQISLMLGCCPETRRWTAAPGTTPTSSAAPATWSSRVQARARASTRSRASPRTHPAGERRDLRHSACGNALDNLIIGNEGANVLDGGAGNDALAGAGGNDNLTGGSGDDFLNGGPGNDIMDGGLGNDFYVVDSSGDVILPEGTGFGAGTDVVASAVSFVLGAGLEVLVMAPSALNGTGNELDNTIFANDAPNILLGGGGVDVLAGGGGNDIIDGGPGGDVLMGGAGTDSTTGGFGDDYLDGELGNDTLVGGDGNDTYIVDSPFDVVVEAAGATAGSNDIVASTTSYALGANVESLILSGSANIAGAGNVLGNYMIGNGGDNTLDGQSGNDTISAAAGNDRLLGGYGDDFLAGGAGNDSFVFFGGFGLDSVADFAAGPGPSDVIEFHDGVFSGFADVLAHAAQTGGNVTITHDPANTITLFNTALASLVPDDFRFL